MVKQAHQFTSTHPFPFSLSLSLLRIGSAMTENVGGAFSLISENCLISRSHKYPGTVTVLYIMMGVASKNNNYRLKIISLTTPPVYGLVSLVSLGVILSSIFTFCRFLFFLLFSHYFSYLLSLSLTTCPYSPLHFAVVVVLVQI